MKVLLDEMMPASLVARFASKGVSAVHVSHLGRAGCADHEVWALAFELDRVVITKNASDFIHLAASGDLHPGLIVLREPEGQLTTDEIWQCLEPVLDKMLPSGGDFLNQLVEVFGPCDFQMRGLPPVR